MIYDYIKYQTLILIVSIFIIFSSTAYSATQDDVKKFFSKNKVGKSVDYAFVKNGIAGPDHLLTIHGYADDKAVCELLAKEYNGNKSVSVVPGTYQCIPLNK